MYGVIIDNLASRTISELLALFSLFIVVLIVIHQAVALCEGRYPPKELTKFHQVHVVVKHIA